LVTFRHKIQTKSFFYTKIRVFILLSHFSDFFQTEFATYQHLSSYTVLGNGNHYILSSSFIDLLSTESGGAILFSSGGCEICIEECNFVKCISEKLGGAIYTSQTNSIIIVKTCGSDCAAYSSYHFAYIATSYSNILSIISSTIAQCSSDIKINGRWMYYPMSFTYANFSQRYTNVSRNIVSQFSVARYDTNKIGSITYTSYAHNYASDGSGFIICGGPYTFSHSNFVNITQTGSSYEGSILLYAGNPTVNFTLCVFLNNYKILCRSISGTALFSDCSFSHIYNNTNQVTYSSSVLTNTTLNIIHFTNDYCKADVNRKTNLHRIPLHFEFVFVFSII